MFASEQITAWSALFYTIAVFGFQVALWYGAQFIYWSATKYLKWSARRERAKAESGL